MSWVDKIFKRSAPAVTAAIGRTAQDQIKQSTRASRSHARQAARSFHAAMLDRLNGSWTTTPLTADQQTEKDWRILVARNREQAKSNDYAKQFRRLVRVNVLGAKNVQLQAKVRDPNGQIDRLASQAIEDRWDEWGRRGNCDVTGRLTFLQVCGLALDSCVVDGEILAIIVEGKDAGPHQLQIQLVDPVRLDIDHHRTGLPGGNFIRFSIEYTAAGKPVAYYLTALDEESDDYYSYKGVKYYRVPAEDVIHEFLSEQIGQKRGYGWMSTPLQRLSMLGGYEQAALVAARVGAAKMGILKPDPENAEPDEEPDILTDAEPGTFWVAPPGWDATTFEHTYPQGEFGSFHKACLRGISAGLGVAYNNLANDLEGVNFSSIRQGTLDERETYKWIQSWIADVFHDRIYERWLMRQLLLQSILVVGKPLKLERFDKYRLVTWQGRRWQWVDPQADQKAAVDGINNRIQSRGQVILDQGRDPADVEAELQAEEAEADVRMMARIKTVQEQCEKLNKATPGLNLHWSQIVSINGAQTAPGAFLAGIAQQAQAAAQNVQAEAVAKKPSTGAPA